MRISLKLSQSAYAFTACHSDVTPDVEAEPLSRQEIKDLDRLALAIAEVLQVHALENGLPPTYPMSRKLSYEDARIAHQYKLPELPDISLPKPSQASQQSYGAWDTWGKTGESTTSQINPVAGTNTGEEQKFPITTTPHDHLRPSDADTNVVDRQATVETSSDTDGWLKWSVKDATNDAYAQREAMTASLQPPSGASFSSPHALIPPQVVNRNLTKGDSTGATSNESKSPETPVWPSVSPRRTTKMQGGGWVGSKNVEALLEGRLNRRSSPELDFAQDRPHRLSRQSTPTSIPGQGPRRSPPPSMFPTQKSTSGGLDPNISTTGWKAYAVYNPRTRAQPPDGPSMRYAGAEDSFNTRMQPKLTEEAFPPLASGTASNNNRFPDAHQAASESATTNPTTWDDWRPEAGTSGPEAWRKRSALSAEVPQHSDLIQAGKSYLNSSEQVPHRNTAGENQAYDTQSIQLGRSSIRAEAHQGLVTPPIPNQPPAIDGKELAATGPTPTSLQGNEGDGWSNYTPKVSAEDEGNRAYERRLAMANGGNNGLYQESSQSVLETRSNSAHVPVRESRLYAAQSSPHPALPMSTVPTAPTPQLANPTEAVDSDWAAYKPKIAAEVEGSQAHQRRAAMAGFTSATQSPRDARLDFNAGHQPRTNRSDSSTSSTRPMPLQYGQPRKTLNIVGSEARERAERAAWDERVKSSRIATTHSMKYA